MPLLTIFVLLTCKQGMIHGSVFWSLGSCRTALQQLSGAHMRVASGIVLREAGLALAGLRARAWLA
jgi:hypothetical protein